MRIDKFLKNARLIKRRTIAKEACDQDRVSINGRPAKAGAEVKTGDAVLVRFGNAEIRVRVLALTESTRKEDAASMYEVIGEDAQQLL
ncbi:MAG: RNA-binding S4 domain-containing protein [Clostridiales Family XIII bacterium]|jgi:ribosomal 50S subunit-recycling heat shock protein|nr:RNA-binding S4 domain-containing protein [Clostridiales Family XIII bacterium]